MFLKDEDGHANAVRRRLRTTRRQYGRKRGLSVAAVALAAGTFATTNAAQAASGPHRGGSIVELSTGINPTIDPALNLITGTTDEQTLEAVYGPGLDFLNSYTGAVKMGFAQSLTSNDHGRTWTLVLHPGLKFSDGTAFNAAAVKYNWDRLANPATGSTLQSAAAQLSTKVINATTLRITCTPVDAIFPTLVADDFAMIASPKALAAEGTGFGSHPVGAGPFQVQSFSYGISWTFVRNPYYRIFAPGQPYLDSVQILAPPTTQQEVTSLQLGEAQTAVDGNAQQISEERAVGTTVITPPQPKLYEISFNTTVPPFNDITAREAVYYALDRGSAGAAWTSGAPVRNNLFGAKSPFYSQKYDFPAQNAAKAQQLFNQLAAQGHPLNFTFLWIPTGQNGPLGAYVVGALSQFQNVTVTQNVVPTAQYNTDKTAGTFQATGTSINAGMIPGAFTSFVPGGSTNYGQWNDPTVTSALAQLESTTNLTQEKKLWGTVQQEINAQFPVVWLGQAVQGYAYNKSQVGGVTTTQAGTVGFFGPMYRK